MQDAAATLALADRLGRQCALLRAEQERVREVARRLATDPNAIQWTGFARNAFNAELDVLCSAVSTLESQLSDAVANSLRARETLLSHVQ